MTTTTITKSELLEQKRRQEELFNALLVIGGMLIGLIVGLGFIIV